MEEEGWKVKSRGRRVRNQGVWPLSCEEVRRNLGVIGLLEVKLSWIILFQD